MTFNNKQGKTSTAEKLVKNSVWLFLSEVLSKVTALGIQIIAARYLGENGFGVFGFAFIATGVFLDFIDNGLKVFLTRSISRSPDLMADYLHNIFALKWFISFFTVLIFAVVIYMFPLDRETLKVICVIGVSLVINGYTEMYLGVFRGYEQMVLVSKLMFMQRILFFLFGFLVLLAGYQVVEFAVAFLISSVVSFFLTRMQLKKIRHDLKKEFNSVLIRKIFTESLPICGVVLFSYIYFCIDSILLFLMLGKSETGWYFAAFKIIESLALFLASIRGALFPTLSRMCFHDDDHFKGLWKEALKYLIIIGLPISAGTAVLAPQLVDVLYGSHYEISGLVLQIMAIPFFILILNEFIAYFLLSADKTRKVLNITLSGAIFNIALNLLVIPKWGLIGASVVAGLTEFLLLILFFQTINNLYDRTLFLPLIWKPALSALGMAYFLTKVSWPLIPLIFTGMGVYFLTLLLLRAFNEQDFMVLRNIFNREG